ncbi:hypothetical protein E3P99_03117 [Wallemia hederae]|uniref:SAM-dependent MTase RsmB/NOP-type domain-containing protein n=1 Tax=Wallemia hederae TaxID=1540922 RepID=A0A4V4LSR7_9BASI|nr:hypothetical protein E3P99_03117 [Wallemia hederae]
MDFYKKAAEAVEKVLNKQTSVKTFAHSKRLLAVVVETLKYQDVLKQLIEITDLLSKERKAIKFAKPQGNPIFLVMVLLHDLLFSKRQAIEAGQGPIKDAILRHKTRLRGELTKLRVRAGVTTNEELGRKAESAAELIPRYVRINSNRISLDDAIAEMKKAFGLAEYTGDDMPIPADKYKIVKHIPNLVAVHASLSQRITSHTLYTNGRVILQDLASCMPPVVLLHELVGESKKEGKRRANEVEDDGLENVGTVIDGTAAPGNKTTLLSALMRNKGKILAYEHVPKRYETLEKMVAMAGCQNVETVLGDFTKCDPKSRTDVTHILLDPSCTGSGIVNRLDYLTEQENDDKEAQDERMSALSAFQETIIGHAMKFPNVRRIVYSTCSIHEEENESVVMSTLIQHPEFNLAGRQSCLKDWPTRGHSEPFGGDSVKAESVIRCTPGTDLTNGFFVACFDRIDSAGGVADDGHKQAGQADAQPAKKRRKNKKKSAKSAKNIIIV